jgi:hypothetical protein
MPHAPEQTASNLTPFARSSLSPPNPFLRKAADHVSHDTPEDKKPITGALMTTRH